MINKTILITGGTDGMGKATALRLAKSGDNVTIVGRNPEKGYHAQQTIAEVTGASVSFIAIDMSRMYEIQRFATEYLATHPKLDYLIHCAGVIMQEPVMTDEGNELVFATQYLSRYYLTQLLLPVLNPKGKVVFVSGGNVTEGEVDYRILNSEENFGMVSTVSNTSRAQSLYTLVLMSEHPTLGVYNYGPGIVKTSIGRNMSGIRSLVATIISQFFAVSPENAGQEIAELLTESYESGWYKKGLEYQQFNGETFTGKQDELKEFSDNLLHPYK